MQFKNTTETIAHLQQAAVHLAMGFERAQATRDNVELAEQMREAAAALIEMRRTTDDLIRRLRYSQRPEPR